MDECLPGFTLISPYLSFNLILESNPSQRLMGLRAHLINVNDAPTSQLDCRLQTRPALHPPVRGREWRISSNHCVQSVDNWLITLYERNTGRAYLRPDQLEALSRRLRTTADGHCVGSTTVIPPPSISLKILERRPIVACPKSFSIRVRRPLLLDHPSAKLL
jgi:hypothetical protein